MSAAQPIPIESEPGPTSTPAEAIGHLQEFVERSNLLLQKEPTTAEMEAFREALRCILEDAFGERSSWWDLAWKAGSPYAIDEFDPVPHRHNEIREKHAVIAECIIDLKRKANRAAVVAAEGTASSLETLKNILLQFHRVASRLRKRHSGRETLVITDEYDVQDLLHALLTMHFADIRAEEFGVSFAGASPRMDFLLKREEIVVEVKKTRESSTTKSISDELIADIARYQSHPNCKTLVCFVYDPEGRISNVAGFIHDLQTAPSKMTVHVLVVPQQ